MNRAKADAAFWLLIFLAIVLGIMDAPAQAWSVGYNPNTGRLNSPTAGKRPLIFQAEELVNTTDAGLSLSYRYSQLRWNVAAQAATRTVTLPTIGDDPGEFPPGQPLVIYIADSNEESVAVNNAAASLLATLSDQAGSDRYVFYSLSTGTWLPINQSFGTAAYVDTGTSGGTVGLLNGNWVKTGTTSFGGVVTITASPLQLTAGASGTAYINVSSNAGGGQIEFGSAGTAGAFFTDSAQNDGCYKVPAGNAIRFGVGINPATAFKITATGVTTGSAGTEFKNIYYKPGTLSGGTVTITDANIGSTDIIMPVGLGATNAGALYRDSINAGVSFTIKSTDPSDARDIQCIIYDIP